MHLYQDSMSNLVGYTPTPIRGTVIAQAVRDADVMGQMQKSFNNFVQSGQIWALLIGLVIGYMIRSLTSYG
ncbi:hypothetical protein [Calothrix rhizosoleniae]|uniref:hypothetical protein n=2 Tax=Calothrix rhizosoleniae TaxID=888997 RepID=UPI000B4A52DD|nr:hypothetical protein [Calothrix rhizosoleniae]